MQLRKNACSGESADALKRRVQELETERDTIKEKAQFLEEKCSQLMEDISRFAEHVFGECHSVGERNETSYCPQMFLRQTGVTGAAA